MCVVAVTHSIGCRHHRAHNQLHSTAAAPPAAAGCGSCKRISTRRTHTHVAPIYLTRPTPHAHSPPILRSINACCQDKTPAPGLFQQGRGQGNRADGWPRATPGHCTCTREKTLCMALGECLLPPRSKTTAADPSTENSCRRSTRNQTPPPNSWKRVAACSCKQCACCSAEHVVEGHAASLCVVAEGAQLAERLERHTSVVEGAAAAQALAQHVLHACLGGRGSRQKWQQPPAVRKECAFVACRSNRTASRQHAVRAARCALLWCSRFFRSQQQTTNKQQSDNDSPASSSTARTAPPAMTPVPSAAGCSTTPAALNQASLRWGMVPAPTRGTSTMFCGDGTAGDTSNSHEWTCSVAVHVSLSVTRSQYE